MSRKSICEICCEIADLKTLKEHFHDDFSACVKCWKTFIDLRAAEFGDLKCLKKDCCEEVSEEFLINQIKIDALTVSNWKKNAVNARQDRIKRIKENTQKYICKVENCGQPILKIDNQMDFFYGCSFFLVIFSVVFYNEFKDYIYEGWILLAFFTFSMWWISFIFQKWKTRHEDRKVICCNNNHVEPAKFDENDTLILETTRPCPTCHVRIEREFGCPAMRCSQCDCFFCYYCCSESCNCY